MKCLLQLLSLYESTLSDNARILQAFSNYNSYGTIIMCAINLPADAINCETDNSTGVTLRANSMKVINIVEHDMKDYRLSMRWPNHEQCLTNNVFITITNKLNSFIARRIIELRCQLFFLHRRAILAQTLS